MSHAQNWSMQIDGAAARDAGAGGTGVPDIQSSLYRGQGECFAKLYSSAWLQAMAVYYGVAVVLHYVIPALANPHRVQHGEVQPSSETRRDAVRALVPVAIRAGILAVAEGLHQRGYGVMGSESLLSLLSSPWGVLYVMVMVIALDFFHDTWFYFAHRLLHHRYLMRHVHYMHHQSRVPSAFSGYSFHWIEAIVMFTNALVEIFIFPIPNTLHRIYELWMIVIHVGGHCGFEMFPFIPHMAQLLWMLSGCSPAVRKAINDVHHHDIHHRYPGYHYSLYFTHWDALLGTLHPEWIKSVANSVASDPNVASDPSSAPAAPGPALRGSADKIKGM